MNNIGGNIMRCIYSESDIRRYINGEDVGELEDDPYFMSEVIKWTGDYNIYKFHCDEKVKLSPVMLMTMLEVFGDSYLEKDEKNFYKGLTALAKRPDNIDSFYSGVDSVNLQFLNIMILLNRVNGTSSEYCDELFDKEISFYTDEYGMINDNCNGLFGILSRKYKSDLAMEFFASKLADKIIRDVYYNGLDDLSYRGVENIVHSKIDNKECLDEEMVICAIISCLAKVDSSLSEYFNDHKELLEQYGRNARRYYRHWDSYESEKMNDTVESFINTATAYIVDNQLDAVAENVIRGIGKKYGLDSLFDDYYIRMEEERREHLLACRKMSEENSADADAARRKYMDEFRQQLAMEKVECKLDSPVFRPLLNLAKRTFGIKEKTDSNKVFCL